MSSLLGTIGTIVVLVIGVVGLIGIAAAITVYFRGSRDAATISTLKSNNEALTDRVTLLEAEMGRLKGVDGENARLRGMRPSAEAIAAIGRKLDRHDADIKRLLREGAKP